MTTINQTDFQSTTKHKQTLKKSFIFYSHSEMKQNFLNDAILYHFQENKTKYVNKQKAEIVFGFWFTITIRFHLLDGSNFQHCLKILKKYLKASNKTFYNFLKNLAGFINKCSYL